MFGLSDVELIGMFSALMTTMSFLPQMLVGLRAGALESLSFSTYALLAAGKSSWIVYGTMLGSLPILLANILSLGLVLTILGMKLFQTRLQ